MLEVLDERGEPLSLAALATATGLHINTLREHLDALAGAGLVRRERAPVAGRGRPAWLYSAVPDDELPGGVAEYAGLASALAETIEQTSSSPRRDAIDAGRRWGRQLATALGPGTGDGAAVPGEGSCSCSTVSGSPRSRTRGMRSSG